MVMSLLRDLRLALLYTADVDAKIGLCGTIFDCALLSESFGGHTLWGPPNAPPGRFALDLRLVELGEFAGRAQSFEPTATARLRRLLELISTQLASGLVTVSYGNSPDGDWELPASPARPPSYGAGQIGHPEDELLRTLHGQIFGIEVCAAEVCAFAALLDPDMPIELDLMLARQTYEEGRHASLLLEAFRRRGGEVGFGEMDLTIWRNARLGRLSTHGDPPECPLAAMRRGIIAARP